MLDRYFTIKETKGIAGQRSTDGMWYCKELPFEDADDLKKKAGAVNRVLNQLNTKKEKVSRTLQKEKKPKVKGLE